MHTIRYLLLTLTSNEIFFRFDQKAIIQEKRLKIALHEDNVERGVFSLSQASLKRSSLDIFRVLKMKQLKFASVCLIENEFLESLLLQPQSFSHFRFFLFVPGQTSQRERIRKSE